MYYSVFKIRIWYISNFQHLNSRIVVTDDPIVIEIPIVSLTQAYAEIPVSAVLVLFLFQLLSNSCNLSVSEFFIVKRKHFY